MPTDGERLIKKIHRAARTAAVRDLIFVHRAEYDMLLDGWVAHYKREMNWTPMPRPGRPRGNAQDTRPQ